MALAECEFYFSFHRIIPNYVAKGKSSKFVGEEIEECKIFSGLKFQRPLDKVCSFSLSRDLFAGIFTELGFGVTDIKFEQNLLELWQARMFPFLCLSETYN